MTEKKEELKPCPWCGKPPVSMKPSGYDNQYRCGNHQCPRYGGPPDEWNSAWCWKEISRLEAEVERLKGDVKMWVDLANHEKSEKESIKSFRDKYLNEERQKSQEALARLKEETEKREALEKDITKVDNDRYQNWLLYAKEHQRRKKAEESFNALVLEHSDLIEKMKKSESQLSIAKEGLKEIRRGKTKDDLDNYTIMASRLVGIASETLKKLEAADAKGEVTGR